MLIRTYTRTFLNDILKNKFLMKIFSGIVNFYCKLWFNKRNTIKFSANMTIDDLKGKKPLFFQSVTGDAVDCK